MLEAASWVVKAWWLIYTDLLFAFACCEKLCKHTEEEWMSVKPDRWIRRMALEHKMIEPFTDRQMREGVISYGVSSYGYDIRVADEFRIFHQREFHHRRPQAFRSALPWSTTKAIPA